MRIAIVLDRFDCQWAVLIKKDKLTFVVNVKPMEQIISTKASTSENLDLTSAILSLPLRSKVY